MRLATIVCEFNPLHTGHKKLIDFAKSIADNVVCIMSGNFTQRGLPACADKYSRAKHAILAGADLVVELPTVFATSSAENFAYGGISIAQRLGADCLVFGSECGDIDILKRCLDKINECEQDKTIQAEIAKGVSYPKAIANATGLDILDKPNNTLAIEYLKALQKIHATIMPVTIKREDNYNSTSPRNFASSMSLRVDKSLRSQFTFDYVSQDINDEILPSYHKIAMGFLAVATKEQLEKLEGVTEGLHNRIYTADKNGGYDTFMDNIKTKRYTRLKLQRIALNCVLGITKDIVAKYKARPLPIKVLAVKSQKTLLLSGIDNETDEITQRADRLYSVLSNKESPQKLLKL